MAGTYKSSKPSRNTVYTKRYSSFLGVDFSKDESMVDDSRSPDAENIIRGDDGLPEKRVGWRTLKNFPGRINGVYHVNDGKNDCTVVHAGDSIYKLTGESEECIYSGCADNRSQGKSFRGKLCILTGQEFLVFNGEKCARVSDSEDVYAPITHMQRGVATMKWPSDDTTSNSAYRNWIKHGNFPSDIAVGTAPEEIVLNLISGKRRNTFERGSGSFFILDKKIDPGSRIIMRYITTGETIFDIEFSDDEKYQDDWYCADSSLSDEEKTFMRAQSTGKNNEKYLWVGNSELNNCGYVVCHVDITALTGYASTTGVDDFSIEYSHKIDGYAERIDKCRFMDVFENRVFFSGNPDYPNVDWYSGVNDPLFVPDINYTEVGLSSNRIMGYLKVGSDQAILKSNGEGPTMYLRSYQTLSDGKVIFPLKQGIGGVGAISGAMTEFLDDPVFLTHNGVYAIAIQDVSSERVLNLRSTRINSRLLRELDPENVLMCEWEGFLLVCVDNKCFVADAGQKTYSENKTGTFEYEWYYWTNIPARTISTNGKALYFGTEDGRLCRFNNDLTNEKGELLMKAYSDDGEAICAYWSTPLSDDGDFMSFKTLVKKGSGVFLKAYERSGVEVSIKTDDGVTRKLAERSAGIFNFEDVDFSDFTFNTSPYAVVPWGRKVKKYKAIQIICKNKKPNQAFGIGGITRKYFYTKTYK